MRVLCITETLGRGGGAEQLIFSLAPHFKSLGVEVHYLALFPYEDDLGIILQSQGHKVYYASLKRKWNLWKGYSKIRKLLDIEQFDILWGHLFFGNIYASILCFNSSKPKSIITLHNEGYSQLSRIGIRLRLRTLIEKVICSRSTAKCAVSFAVKIDYEAFFKWQSIAVIYNGVDTELLGSSQSSLIRDLTRSKLGIPKDGFFILVPARFVKKKGHVYFIRALNLLRNEGHIIYAFFASAQGPERTTLLNEIKNLSLSEYIQLSESTVPHEILYNQIKAADAVVIPSLREPFGIAAAEAMACGTPTVLTKVDGFCELVGCSNSAMMVAPANVDELASAIKILLLNPVARKVIGQNGRQRVQDYFDIKTCANSWTIEFIKVIDQVRTLNN